MLCITCVHYGVRGHDVDVHVRMLGDADTDLDRLLPGNPCERVHVGVCQDTTAAREQAYLWNTDANI